MRQNNLEAFRSRQQQDLKRYNQGFTTSARRRPLHEQYRDPGHRDERLHCQSTDSDASGDDGVGWRDSEGDRLDDFGVDASAEFYDDDDLSLAELLRRRHEPTHYNSGNRTSTTT